MIQSAGTVGHPGSPSCAIGSSGTAFCFGPNDLGNGDGSRGSRGKPVRVVGLTGAKTSHHACVVDAEGVLCWGNNGPGSCGVLSTSMSRRPSRQKDCRTRAACSPATAHLARSVRTDGCFAGDEICQNQLGGATGSTKPDGQVPSKSKELKDVQSVAIGDSHLRTDKARRGLLFGSNEHGRSGGQGSVVPRHE